MGRASNSVSFVNKEDEANSQTLFGLNLERKFLIFRVDIGRGFQLEEILTFDQSVTICNSPTRREFFSIYNGFRLLSKFLFKYGFFLSQLF
jgi:hypothetical protein